ncbi:hypothetical protein NQ318_003038 [Aromia moschata]|uniref:Uncharacterized protein n=1 Tax=Aromia moschata TaxID=1265417 RepID=A0AAV8X3Z5_9CUCU|nr:hypothetical protein NQ318_003038 [Aromia moschata]
MGHVRKVPSKRQAVVDDDTKLNLLLALEENPTTPARLPIPNFLPRVPDSNKTYFMPHRAVYRDDKDTSKIRVVFDASAHAPGLPSLNDVLLQGENLVPNLLRMLMNHRVEKDNGEVDCRFFMAKSRVAPINNKGENTLTLPRLDLTTAVLKGF